MERKVKQFDGVNFWKAKGDMSERKVVSYIVFLEKYGRKGRSVKEGETWTVYTRLRREY
ncbi:MAG: hypothetical protein KAR08_01470 [Candidatus Heimdallarchaeota archaeon]|nr:hypothetical protein [Candidatus Heimdallarchaeota archaeon]